MFIDPNYSLSPLTVSTLTRCMVRLELQKLSDEDLHTLEENTLQGIKRGAIDDQMIIIYEECQIALVMRGYLAPSGMNVSVQWEPLIMAVSG